MNCKQIFGIQFRKARKEMRLSQEEVAEQLGGIARSVISNWENGNTSPLLERLDDISQVLKKPISYFFESTENEEQYGIGDRELAGVLLKASENLHRVRVQAEELLGSVFLISRAFEALSTSEAMKFKGMLDWDCLDDVRQMKRDELQKQVAYVFKRLDQSLPKTEKGERIDIFDMKIGAMYDDKFELTSDSTAQLETILSLEEPLQ